VLRGRQRMKEKTSRRQFAFGTGAAFLAPQVVSPKRTLRPPRGTISDGFLAGLPRLMELAGVPGLSFAMIKDGKLAFARGFGVKKSGENDAVDADTIFGAASLSKPVFSYAVLRMRDEKLIDLDRPLFQYFPYPDLADEAQARLITARQVMSQSTGFVNWRNAKNERLSPAFKPGGRFSYSGEGFYFLQRAVEEITGKGFEGYIQERVLRPLGMTSSTYVWMKETEARVSWGHNNRVAAQQMWNARQGPRLLEIAQEWRKPLPQWRHDDTARALPLVDKNLVALPNFMIPNCAGSLITTAKDYAQFMIRLMGGIGDSLDLAEASRREMLTPQVKINSALGWGLGLGLEREAAQDCFWHWGDNGTFKAFMMGDAAARSGVVVFTNATNGHRLWERIVAQATGRDHAAFLFWMV